MNQYTKGEWKTGKPYCNGYKIPIYADTEEGKDYEIATVHIYNGEQEANAQLIASAPRLHKELVEADRLICELCKRLNPQHATADYGKGCEWCGERDSRFKLLQTLA